MLELRPLVIDKNGIIIGGNMRYKALTKLGFIEIPDNWVKRADDLTPDEIREFTIKDNLPFGDWDWDILANEWEPGDLIDWGLELPIFEGDKTDENFSGNTVIKIDFNPDDFENAKKIIDHWKKSGLYIGGFLIEKLNDLENIKQYN